MEAIVFSGTKLNIDYYINKILDEEQQQEIMDYFMEASSDNISEAFDEFEGDYAEEDLRLMRLKLHSKHGNWQWKKLREILGVSRNDRYPLFFRQL